MGFIAATFFSDETHCLLYSESQHSIKLVSLKQQDTANSGCSEEFVSIGKNQSRNVIVASSYHNYIKDGKQPTIFGEAEGNMPPFHQIFNTL
jgi:hypothetical protein